MAAEISRFLRHGSKGHGLSVRITRRWNVFARSETEPFEINSLFFSISLQLFRYCPTHVDESSRIP